MRTAKHYDADNIYTETHKIALYFMFIHRENALKAHQHIWFYTCHFKKKKKKKLIKIFTKTHEIAHLKKILQGSMPPGMCATDINIFV